MKSIKRIFAVLILVVVAVILSYLVYTGKAVAAIDDTVETARWVGGLYG